jgi:hypothetical protein
VKENVPPESQQSVLRALELFWRFVEKHKWTGVALSAGSYRLPSGIEVKLRMIGRYYSEHLKETWILALQPRQDDAPNPEQYSMWRSALFYEFCKVKDNVMIVDLSKNMVSQKRELRELTARKCPILARSDLEDRLELVAACYRKAVELIPERPSRPKFDKDSGQSGFKF